MLAAHELECLQSAVVPPRHQLGDAEVQTGVLRAAVQAALAQAARHEPHAELVVTQGDVRVAEVEQRDAVLGFLCREEHVALPDA